MPSRHSTTTTSYDDAEDSDVDENFDDDETDESSLHLIVSDSVDSDDDDDSKQGLPPSEDSDGDDDEDSERDPPPSPEYQFIDAPLDQWN